MNAFHIPQIIFGELTEGEVISLKEQSGVKRETSSVKNYQSVWLTLRTFDEEDDQKFSGLYFYNSLEEALKENSQEELFSITVYLPGVSEESRKDKNGFVTSYEFSAHREYRQFDPTSEFTELVIKTLERLRWLISANQLSGLVS